MYSHTPETNRLAQFRCAALVVIGLIAVAVSPVCASPGDQLFKLLPNDGEDFDYFGNAIAIDGSIVAVGAYGSDASATDSGAAYLFDASTGVQLRRLLPSGGAAADFFGYSIAIADGVVAVGAIGRSDNGPRSGAVYLFNASTGEQLRKITPFDGAAGDLFGASVAIDNGVIAIGAYQDSERGVRYGSAYLFEVATGRQLAKLVADDRDADDFFGFSIAIANGIVVVGAPQDDDNGADSGSIYTFDVSTGAPLHKILPSDGRAGDSFGSALALDHNMIVVGAVLADDDTSGNDSGSAYIFAASSGALLSKLLPNDGAAADHFGHSVAIDFGLVAIGSRWDDDKGFDSGSTYIFDGFAGEQLGKLLPSDGAARDHFGYAVAANAGVVAVAAWQDDENGLDSGSAYLFDVSFKLQCLELTVNNLIAGAYAIFTITGGTPGALGVTVYGTQPGQVLLTGQAGYCVTFGIKGINPRKVIGGNDQLFDDKGKITFDLFIPIQLPGTDVLFQSAQHDTCPNECVSNLVELTVR